MIGEALSHYRILEELGAGGMGVVFRARDTKLGRDVAIKVLSPKLAQDGDRFARFEREARLLASLNHPHIATLYGFEQQGDVRFLVMELVEGETLASKIASGPVPVREALGLFHQIAEGLEAAHEKGIVHRDLKPSNIKITNAGQVKVLDFGLAKPLAGGGEPGSPSESPTITRTGTAYGVILGTAAYMSPEQARGKAVDKRTDVWSFGCCLFETLAGRPAFSGETVSDIVARILEREPDWNKLPLHTPARIRDLLEKCLSKEPRERLHDIADARIEIRRVLGAPDESGKTSDSRSRSATLLAVGAATGVTLISLWNLTGGTAPTDRSVTRSVLELPEGSTLTGGTIGNSVAISPDGRFVAYITGEEGRLYLQSLEEGESRPVEGGEGATVAFFSPDSESVGFARERELMRAAVSGGAPNRIAAVSGGPRGVDWGRERLVFAGEVSTGLLWLPAAGGELRELTALDSARREKSHRFPQVLPGGKAVLFTLATSTTESWDDASIAVLTLDTGKYQVVLEGGSHARYSTTGHLLYARGGSLFAVTFDLDRTAVTGQPLQVVENVMTSVAGGGAAYALSENGTLVYAPGRSRTEDRRVVRIDRQGRVEPLVETPRPFANVQLSRDGRYLVLQIHAGIDTIWVYEVERGTLTRLTSEWDNAAPLFDPTGREVAFTSARAGPYNLYKQASDGSGEAERLATSPYTQVPTSWSPDGSTLLYRGASAENGWDIWMVSLATPRESKPFLEERANEGGAVFSPDGRFIAYESDRSGKYEIYLRRYPDGGGFRQVSTDGGTEPAWSPKGDELFYRSGEMMMAVDVRTEGELALGRPRVLFERLHPRGISTAFAVTPDGQAFVAIDDSVAEPPPAKLVLVQNFSEELKRLLPVR